MSVTAAELLQIRVELEGARKAREESDALAKSQKGIGTATTVAGNAAVGAEKKTSRLSRAFSALGKMARWGLGGLAVGGAAVALWGKKAVSSSTELAKATISLHKNFGLSVLRSSEWASEARVRGADTTKLGMAFKTLAGAITTARDGSATGITMFKRLGFSMADIGRAAKDPNFLLAKVADGLKNMKAGADKTAISGKAFGRGWQTIAPMLREGSKAMNESLNLSKKAGAVFSDEKGLNGVFAIVEAQRELERANLGLQLSFTRALGPSIIQVTEWMGQFVRVLNDPKLSGEQKINHITKMFGGLTDKLVTVVSDALPKVAEGAGKIGVAMAGAVWTGFKNSGLFGKLVISAWLFKALGGFSAVGTAGAKVGGKLATSLGWRFLETVAPYFAAEAGVEGFGSTIAKRFGALRPMFSRWGGRFAVALAIGFVTIGLSDAKTRNSLIAFGSKLGRWFVEGLSSIVNEGIGKLNDVIQSLNPLGSLGISTLPEIPEVNLGFLKGPGAGALPFGDGTSGGSSGSGGGPHPHHPHHSHSTPKLKANKIRQFSNFGPSGQRTNHIHKIYLNGKEIAEAVTEEAHNEAAFGR